MKDYIMSEMESLNLEDLDVDQLERRVELSSVVPIGDASGGYSGDGCDTLCAPDTCHINLF